MTISPYKPSYVKGRRARPVVTYLWYVFAIAAVLAFLFAPPYLARELSGVPDPSRNQIKAARAVIAAAITLPAVLGMAWVAWRSRNAHPRTSERRPRAPLQDSSKRTSIESVRPRKNVPSSLTESILSRAAI